jgi:LmbE family N-acetylglucosaminyl deacetylase
MSGEPRIVVIAPHPDDEAIGCGGAIALHHDRGERVGVLFLTSGEGGLRGLAPADAWAVREAEARAALADLSADLLGFLRLPDGRAGEELDRAAAAVAAALSAVHAETIYLPHPDEDHPDHAACLPVLARAYALLGRSEPWLLGYEVWTPMSRYDHVEDVSGVYDRKLAAVRRHASQVADFAYDRAVAGLNAYRGALAARCDYAEVFQSLTFATAG